MCETLALETENLGVAYSRKQVLSNVSIHVPAGGIYAFLGRNGAGKSTTIRLLLRLLKPNTGTIKLFGQELQTHYRKLLPQVGSLVEAPGFYPHLSAKENLDIARVLRRLPRNSVPSALDLTDLADLGNKPVGQFSMGMKQRLGLAWALLGSPRILILDEPINGLDPAGVREVRSLLRYLSADKGITIFLSSHILSEVQQLANRIGILHAGRLLTERDPAQDLADTVIVKIRCERCSEAARLVNSLPWISKLDAESPNHMRLTCPVARCAELNALLVGAGFPVAEFSWEHLGLEDYFLQLTEGNTNA